MKLTINPFEPTAHVSVPVDQRISDVVKRAPIVLLISNALMKTLLLFLGLAVALLTGTWIKRRRESRPAA
jgi:hypothetical protein